MTQPPITSYRREELYKLISAASWLAGYASTASELGTRKIPQCWLDGLNKRIQDYYDAADEFFSTENL